MDRLNAATTSELFDEPILNKINDRRGFIFSLLKFKDALNKEVCSSQIHKYGILALAEKHIILPVKFKKWHYGPFSVELDKELTNLENQKIINIDRQDYGLYKKHVITLTTQGKREIKKDKSIEKINHKLNTLFNEYNDNTASSLRNYCYNAFLLKNKNRSSVDWKSERKAKIRELNVVCIDLIHSFSNALINENKKIIICTQLDYVNTLISKAIPEIDEVVSGVILNNAESYLSNWNRILMLIDTNQQNNRIIRKIILENRKIFGFLNYFAKEYGIYFSVFDENAIIN